MLSTFKLSTSFRRLPSQVENSPVCQIDYHFESRLKSFRYYVTRRHEKFEWLRAIPNLSRCEKLEVLYLKGCKRLVELPSHVQYLNKLVAIDLSDCPNLIHLPTRLNSKCLEYVYLSRCPKLTHCPEINSELGLHVLDLEETPVIELPSAIHNVKKGGTLSLCGKHITSFPQISKSLKLFRLCHTTITNMEVQDEELFVPRFGELELVENSKLATVPNNIWDTVKHELRVNDSPLIESLPDISNPVKDLTVVSIENCRNLKRFPSAINHLKSVHTICFSGTGIKSLPCTIHWLEKLCYLVLDYCEGLESIPENIHQLAKLELLALRGCAKIQALPQLLPPELKYLYLGGCKSLQALPSNIGMFKWWVMHFENCLRLDYKLADQIAADFHSRAMTCPGAEGTVLYSGSELPGWCHSNGSDINWEVELPPVSDNLKLVKGIAFGVVFSSVATTFGLKMELYVSAARTSTIATFSSRHRIHGESGATSSSDYVFLKFVNNFLGVNELADHVPMYMKHYRGTLSFRAYAEPDEGGDVKEVEMIKFKRLGVSPLY